MYKPGKQNQAVDAFSHIPTAIDDLHALHNGTTFGILYTWLTTVIPELILDACTTAEKEFLTRNLILSTLRCPYCLCLHLDLGKLTIKKHIMHMCLSYTITFKILPAV